MGKKKVPYTKRICATAALHQGVGTWTQLVHGSTVRSATTKELLSRVGKCPQRFAGRFCIDCINLVSPEEAIRHQHAVQPGSSILTAQNSEDVCSAVKDGMDLDFPNEVDKCTETTQEKSNVLTDDTVVVLSMKDLRKDLEALSPEIRALIAFELAASEKAKIKSDALDLTRGEFRDFDSLSNICNTDYLLARNNVLLHFVIGLWSGKPLEGKSSSHTGQGNLPVPIERQSDIYKLAKTIESCMGLTTPITVLPFHFREIILLYSITKSRAAVTLMAATGPTGSYQTTRNSLDKLADSNGELKLSGEKGDAVCVFDNNQVLQRRWNISVNNRAVCNVITMVIFVDIDSEGTLQFCEELKPSKWMWTNLDDAKKAALMEGHRNSFHQDTRYRKHFHPWLTGIIQQVAREQSVIDGKCLDEIDEQVAVKAYAKSFSTCPKCGITNIPKAKRKCPSCNESIRSTENANTRGSDKETHTENESKGEIRVLMDRKDDSKYHFTYEKSTRKATEYDHLPQHHPKEPPEIKVGEPIFANPCSYTSVAQVFRQIGKQAGIRKYGGNREWITIVCDGLPYVIGYQLIERTFQCTMCGESVSGLDERKAHREKHEDPCTFTMEFDWVLLQPGAGHIEMNMLKTFVKFSWPIFWEGMVELFNFRSEIAKKSAQNVNDHHKGMTLARIARDSFAKELVLPYVRQELLKGQEQLSVAGYLKFAMSKAVSPNYGLMFELTFSILDAIFLYRAGLRCGDPEMVDAGRAFFARMWCARAHPLYRQLAMYDSIMAACMPPEVFNFVQMTKSLNPNGNDYAGEGLDFKLEEINKAIQHWISSLPTDKDWKNACANHSKLSKLRQTFFADMGVKDPKDRSNRSTADISDAVAAFRTSLREKEFVGHYDKSGSLTSFGGQPLDEDLEKFANEAATKESVYLNNFLDHSDMGGFKKKKTVPFKEPPIFVTPQERSDYEDIRNKTVNQCIDIIHMKIDELDDEDMRNNFAEAFERDIRGRNRQTHIAFLELLVEYQSMENTVPHHQADMESEQPCTDNSVAGNPQP